MTSRFRWVLGAVISVSVVSALALAADVKKRGATSYMPVDQKEDFKTVAARMKGEKPAIMKRQLDLLAERYDLANKPAKAELITTLLYFKIY